MGSNRHQHNPRLDAMEGRTFGWGTRLENKVQRKQARRTSNQLAIDEGLADLAAIRTEHSDELEAQRYEEERYAEDFWDSFHDDYWGRYDDHITD